MDISKYRTKYPPKEHEQAVRLLLQSTQQQRTPLELKKQQVREPKMACLNRMSQSKATSTENSASNVSSSESSSSKSEDLSTKPIPSRTIAVQCDLRPSVKRDNGLSFDASMQASSISSTRYGFYNVNPITDQASCGADLQEGSYAGTDSAQIYSEGSELASEVASENALSERSEPISEPVSEESKNSDSPMSKTWANPAINNNNIVINNNNNNNLGKRGKALDEQPAKPLRYSLAMNKPLLCDDSAVKSTVKRYNDFAERQAAREYANQLPVRSRSISRINKIMPDEYTDDNSAVDALPSFNNASERRQTQDRLYNYDPNLLECAPSNEKLHKQTAPKRFSNIASEHVSSKPMSWQINTDTNHKSMTMRPVKGASKLTKLYSNDANRSMTMLSSKKSNNHQVPKPYEAGIENTEPPEARFSYLKEQPAAWMDYNPESNTYSPINSNRKTSRSYSMRDINNPNLNTQADLPSFYNSTADTYRTMPVRKPKNDLSSYQSSSESSALDEGLSGVEPADCSRFIKSHQLDYDSQHRLNESGLPEVIYSMQSAPTRRLDASTSYLGIPDASRKQALYQHQQYATPTTPSSPLLQHPRSNISPQIRGRAMSQQSLTRPTMPLESSRRRAGAFNSGSDVGGSSMSLVSHLKGRYENAHTRTPIIMYIPQAKSNLSLADNHSSSGGGVLRKSSTFLRKSSRSKQKSSSSDRLKRSQSRNGSDSESSSILRTLVRPRARQAGIYASSKSSARHNMLMLGRDDDEENMDDIGQLATELDSYRFRRRYSVPKDAKINWFSKLKQRVSSGGR